MANSPAGSNGKMGPNKIQNTFQNYHKSITNTFGDGLMEDPSPLPREKIRATQNENEVEEKLDDQNEVEKNETQNNNNKNDSEKKDK